MTRVDRAKFLAGWRTASGGGGNGDRDGELLGGVFDV